jgi:hypothetical protein
MTQISDAFQKCARSNQDLKPFLFGTIFRTPRLNFSKTTEFDCMFDAYSRIVQQYRERFSKRSVGCKRYDCTWVLNYSLAFFGCPIIFSHTIPTSSNFLTLVLSHRTPDRILDHQDAHAPDLNSQKKASLWGGKSSPEAALTLQFSSNRTPALPSYPQFSLMRTLSEPSLHNKTPDTQPKSLRPLIKRRR